MKKYNKILIISVCIFLAVITTGILYILGGSDKKPAVTDNTTISEKPETTLNEAGTTAEAITSEKTETMTEATSHSDTTQPDTTQADTTVEGIETGADTKAPVTTTEAVTTEDVTTEEPPMPNKHGVTLSSPHGFYNKPFKLTMESDGGTIYYTTDGSVPTNKSKKYTKAIDIKDATDNENVWSARTDVSTGFLIDAGYSVPDFKVDKCTVIRAIAYYKDGSKSDIETATYFVGYNTKSGYDGMNIISITTDPDNLFGYVKGIYVRGKVYDTYVTNRNNGVTKWYDPYWWWWDCNYNQKGSATERPATVQIFSSSHNLLLTKDIGIRIQGGGSRGKIPKSFNLYARKEYDGVAKMGITPFGTSYNPQRVTLFAGGDDNEYKLNDWLMSRLASERNFSTMDFTPFTLFLEGEYWGNYWMTEKYDDEYLHYHYGVKKSNVVMIKNGAIEEGENNDIKLYNEMRSFVLNNDMTIAANYDKACKLIDIQSFIDYYAAEIYIDRFNDWPGGNFALWRTRTIENGEYGDGRWRWMLFDVNSGGMDLLRVTNDSIEYVVSNDRFFSNLWRNNTFRTQFLKTLSELADNEFKPARVQSLIDEYVILMREPMRKEYSRFFSILNNKIAGFDSKVYNMRSFFNQRQAVIKNLVTKYS